MTLLDCSASCEAGQGERVGLAAFVLGDVVAVDVERGRSSEEESAYRSSAARRAPSRRARMVGSSCPRLGPVQAR